MPQILIKGLTETEVCTLSKLTSQKLSKLLNAPQDWFVFEHLTNKRFICGNEVLSDVAVDIWWFDRGQEAKDQTAKIINDNILELGYNQIEVAFHNYDKESYFENGIHY